LASVNPACPGRDFTLSLSTYYGNLSGISYQWQSSATAAFSTVTNMGTSSTQVANQVADTYYRCLITCAGNTTISTAILVSTSGPCYCVPSGTSSNYYINNFSTTGGIANISNLNSGYSAGGYGIFTGMTVSQFPGQTINFSSNFMPATGTFGFGIWVDWNSDGDFDDSGEQLYNSGAYVNSPTGSFTVPAGAVLGNYRMRICANYWKPAPIPCETGITGEYEDYTLNVISLGACAGTPEAATTISSSNSVCTGSTINLSLSVNYNNLSGISYQWQSSANGTAYTNVGATTSTYSPTVNSTTWYQCIVTCANGGGQTISTPVQVTVGAPSILTSSGGSRCGTGSVTLSATGNGNQVNWYSASSGGSLLGTGNSFSTPPIASTTSYWVAAQSGGACVGTRVQVNAVIYPSISSLAVNPSSSANCSNTVLAISATGGVSQGAATDIHTQNFNLGLSGYTLTGTGVTTSWVTSPVFEGTGALRLNYSSSSTNGAYGNSSNIDLSGAASATISFSHICALEGSSTAYDKGFVQFSSDGGITWEDFASSDYLGSGALLNGVVAFSEISYTDWRNNIIQSTSVFPSSLWKTELINIPVGGLTNEFRIRFLITSDVSVSFPGWFIDDIKVTKYATGSQQPITWSPVTGLYTDAAATVPYVAGTNYATVYTASTNSITYSASAINASNCYTSANSVITINGPSLQSVTNAEKCGAGTLVLGATAAVGQTINWYSQPTGGSVLFTGNSFTTPNLSSSTTYYASAGSPNSSSIVYTSSGVSSSNTIEYNPYYYAMGSRKTQFLITAAELTALGIGTNVNVNSISFDLLDAGSAMSNFEIRLANVNSNALPNNNFDNATTTLVYSAASITPVAGINTYTFPSNFTRTNQSLLVQVCWNNNNSGGSFSPRVRYDNTGHFSSSYQGANNASACGLTSSAGRVKRRPKIGMGIVSTALCFGPRLPVLATIKPLDTWIGVNSNWNDPLNWCPAVPTIATNVTIPIVSSGIYPVLTNGQTAYCNNISIASGGPSLTLNNGSVIEAYGNFANSGTLVNNGRISLKGSGDQAFPGAGTVTAMSVFAVDKTAGTVQVNNHFFIDSALLPLNRMLALNNFNITLRSTAAKTAYVAQVGAAAGFTYGSGRFIVERYISYTRKWQLLSVPANTTQSTWASWQNAGVYIAGSGVKITGPVVANGIDDYSNMPSMKYQAGCSQYFTPITATNTAGSLLNAKGYYLFVYGDRSASANTAAGPATTIQSTGTLFVGNGVIGEQPATVSATASTAIVGDDHMSVGNPFASPINFATLRANNGSGNFKDNFKVWDPSQPGSWDAGVYQTITGVTQGLATPGGGSIYNAAINYNDIQSGQAFYLEATNPGTVSVSFNENIKSSTQRLANRGGSGSTQRNPLNISMISALIYTNNGTLLDGNRVVLDDQYSDAIDEYDAGKLWNEGANFGILKHQTSLAVEARPTLHINDTIQYEMYGLNEGSHQLKLAMQQVVANGLQGYFVDRFLNTEVPVSSMDSSFINFTVTSSPGSQAPNRFLLVFKQLAVVPVQFVDLQAQWVSEGKASVRWKVENELGIDHYVLLRSADGISFTALGETNAAQANEYAALDERALLQNYYRVKAVSANGTPIYSNVVMLRRVKGIASMKVIPNPVKDKNLRLRMEDFAKGWYELKLWNMTGESMMVRKVFISEVKMDIRIVLPRVLGAGAYQLGVYDAEGRMVEKAGVVVE
jgi:hypothetical protein